MNGQSILKKVLCVCWLFFMAAGLGFGLEEEINSNYYYSYPGSFGIGYQQVFFILRDPDFASVTTLSDRFKSLFKSPVDNYSFFMFDVSGTVQVPFKFFPYLQPGLKLGLYQVFGRQIIEMSEAAGNVYNHTHLYGSLGLDLGYRFSKTMEAGLFFYGGISYALFPEFIPDEDDRAQINFLGETGLRFSINPMYNISIDFHPILRYQSALLGSLYTFDGWNLALSGTMKFRLGEDPDLKKGLYRSIQFDEINIPAVFAAMRNFYAEHPLGSAVISNGDKSGLTDIRISFYQAGYMDSPTPVLTIPLLEPGESAAVPLFAVYNSNVLETEGTLPLIGEIIITYNLKDKPGKQTKEVVYTLHDKTALSWDDDRKVAAFVTPADNIIKDYSGFIQQATRLEVKPLFNRPLQAAMQVYTAMRSMGCLYQEDPVLPYSRSRGDKLAIDTVNLPRETIKRMAGDCDDLTVLYLSLLEAQGVETGFITVPGHIYAALNTKLPAGDYWKIHPEPIMTINHGGDLWVPVEITSVGSENFLKAWQTGIKEFLEWEGEPAKRKLYVTREAQEVYSPIALKQQESGLLFSENPVQAASFAGTLARLSAQIQNACRTAALAENSKAAYNRLGIAYATFGQREEAAAAFRQAIVLDGEYSWAWINLADLSVRYEDYASALDLYAQLQEIHDRKGETKSGIYSRLLLRMSVVCYLLDDREQAGIYYARANTLEPEQTRQYAYLAENKDPHIRGSLESWLDAGLMVFEEEGSVMDVEK